MCIGVNAIGSGEDFGSHMTVSVFLMKGEYDSRLVWPFKGDITIQLVNYNDDLDNHEDTVHFDDDAVAAGDVSDKVISGDRAGYGWNDHSFISHTAVEYSTSTRQYIIDIFRITKIVVHSVYISCHIIAKSARICVTYSLDHNDTLL